MKVRSGGNEHLHSRATRTFRRSAETYAAENIRIRREAEAHRLRHLSDLTASSWKQMRGTVWLLKSNELWQRRQSGTWNQFRMYIRRIFMTLGDKVRAFEGTLEAIGFDEYRCFVCDSEADQKDKGRLSVHSTRLLRKAASLARAPEWVVEALETHFDCSCAVFDSGKDLWNVLIAHEERNGHADNAQNLRLRLRGHWDYELIETLEQACGEDHDALQICRDRFKKWQARGIRTRAASLERYLQCVDDPILVALTREALGSRYPDSRRHSFFD